MKYTKTSYRKLELIIPTLLAISLIGSCIIISAKKYYWFDELFSYYFTSDTSFFGMLRAFHDKINNTPIFYFLTGWFWDKIFGSSEISLRLFSCLGFCIAGFFTWAALRRNFNFWSATIGLLGVFCSAEVILDQNAEARMYGLFLAVTAGALFLYDRFYEKSQPSNRLLLYNGLIHAAIIHTHLFGAFYSGAILVAILISDRVHKLFRLRLYLSILLSWGTFLFYLPSFLNQADAGKPHTWIPIPTLKDLTVFYDLSSFFHAPLLLPVIFIGVINFIFTSSGINSDRQTEINKGQNQSKVHMLIFGCIFVLVPAAIWVFSRAIKPVFWERYMIPSVLGLMILLSFLCSLLFDGFVINSERSTSLPFINKIKAGAIGICLVLLTIHLLYLPFGFSKNYPSQTVPGVEDKFIGYSELPIVMTDANSYLKRQYYSSQNHRYFYILDWEAASNPNSGIFPTQEYKHMEALKRNYPDRFKDNVLSTADFLKLHDRFLVISYFPEETNCNVDHRGLEMARTWIGMQCPQWVNLRLRRSPEYQVSILQKNGQTTVYLVSRIGRESK